jgi:hypothetical protein
MFIPHKPAHLGWAFCCLAAGFAASTLVSCQPPAYVVPTSPPSPTSANATLVASLQTGPTATNIAIAEATSIAASPVRITSASLDPQDYANSAVTIANISSANVDLSGWTLLVANYKVTLPTTDYMTVGPGSMLIVHLSSSATPTQGQNVYVGLGALQNTPRANPDQVVLMDPHGQVASIYPAPS